MQVLVSHSLSVTFPWAPKTLDETRPTTALWKKREEKACFLSLLRFTPQILPGLSVFLVPNLGHIFQTNKLLEFIPGDNVGL